VFGSLSADVPPLEDFLGDMRFFHRRGRRPGPERRRVRSRRSVYTYRGNWKLQLDNASILITSRPRISRTWICRRAAAGRGSSGGAPVRLGEAQLGRRRTFVLAHGHAATWLDQPEPEKRPIYPALAAIRERVGAMRAEWMLKARNVHVFPTCRSPTRSR